MLFRAAHVWLVAVCVAYVTASPLDRRAFHQLMRLFSLSQRCLMQDYYAVGDDVLWGSFQILTLPFLMLVDPLAFARVSNGSLYDLVHAPDELVVWSEDKLVTSYQFSEWGLKVPKLVAYTTATGHIVRREDLIASQQYIAKPRYGCLGIGVKVITPSHMVDVPPNTIVQERIMTPTNYRIVTLYDGTVFKVYTHSSKPGTPFHCPRTASPPPSHVLTLSHQLGTIHKTHFPILLSIGWDAIDDFVLEMNLAHAALPSECATRDDIRAYVMYAQKFHEMSQQ